jgi:hypothetical protein
MEKVNTVSESEKEKKKDINTDKKFKKLKR